MEDDDNTNPFTADEHARFLAALEKVPLRVPVPVFRADTMFF